MDLHGLMRNKGFIFIFLLIASFISCTQEADHQKTGEKSQPVPEKIAAPQFNPDSAYQYVKDQVDFGPRVPGSEAHSKCAAYFEKKFASFGWNVLIQKADITAHDGKKLPMKNIIASYQPEKKNRVVLFTHWDSRQMADQDDERKNEPILGASDGGSGSGILLEVARGISMKHCNVGVDIILLDIEDYGISEAPDSYCLGSQYWAKNPHVPGYFAKYGILLDMVGAPGAIFAREAISMQYAPSIVDKVWNTAATIGYSDYFSFRQTQHVGSDDHLYINTIANIPTIDIIQYDPNTRSGFGSFWHTHDDDMDVIDKNTLKAVGQTLLEVIYSE